MGSEGAFSDSRAHIIESIKQTVLSGLGAAVVSQEKLRATLDALFRRGEITKEQTERILGELLAQGKREGRVLGGKVAREISRLLESSPLVTRRELHRLEERVRALETLLGARAPEEVERAAPPPAGSSGAQGTESSAPR